MNTKKLKKKREPLTPDQKATVKRLIMLMLFIIYVMITYSLSNSIIIVFLPVITVAFIIFIKNIEIDYDKPNAILYIIKKQFQILIFLVLIHQFFKIIFLILNMLSK